MKIDILESLGYSFLRHVQGCWLVQTNWKWPGETWSDGIEESLQGLFAEMQERFGPQVFKKTKSVGQLLKQAELDALGVARHGELHALEAAFHEQGLLYGAGVDDTVDTVQKKMLRTCLVLHALDRFEGGHIWFLSPKVTPKPESKLTNLFEDLRSAYPKVCWHLCINQSFRQKVLEPTLNGAQGTSDTSELFVRAERLLRCKG